MLLTEPRDRRLPTPCLMAADVMAIVEIRRQVTAQQLQHPCRLLVVQLLHLIPKDALQLAVGLRMTDSGESTGYGPVTRSCGATVLLIQIGSKRGMISPCTT
jgi:hypothetical protein